MRTPEQKAKDRADRERWVQETYGKNMTIEQHAILYGARQAERTEIAKENGDEPEGDDE